MINLDESIQIIRTMFPDNCIWYSFMCDDLFVFIISKNNKYIKGDQSIMYRSVDRKTKEIKIFDFWSFDDVLSDKIDKGLKNKIKIDIP